MQVSMTVNGSNVSHDVEPRTLLVHYLREQTGAEIVTVTVDTGGFSDEELAAIAARAELGEDAEVQLDVRSRPGTEQPESDPSTPPPPPDRTKARGRRTRSTGRGRREAGPRLDGFEIGDSNRLAYDAACRLGDDLEGSTSVLFVHGDCGIGKTHLLRGICEKRKRHDRRAKGRYLTGEQFTNEYIHAVRNSELDRKVDADESTLRQSAPDWKTSNSVLSMNLSLTDKPTW